ncbi:MAG: SurA N-terminal domain-containing protein [Kiritimatiellae bacterium]|nr:SurA N-terminal domain-containing protein [Kiritimatiellia bacterium]
MFIIKFNNMVRNKWLWGAFALLVAVAFGASDIWSSASRNSGESERIGLLGGKGVDPVQFDVLVRMLRLERRAEGSDEEIRPREVWELVAALRRAEEAGLRVPDAMIGAAIRSDPSFRDESGAFSAERYRQLLAQVDLTPQLYEAIYRDQILLGQVRAAVAAGPWVAPSVLEDRLRGFTDSYTLCTATLSNRFSAASSEVTPEEVRAFYDSHLAEFSEPEKRQVAYVSFRAADYADKVGSFEAVAEGEEDPVLDYYNDHYEDYLDKSDENEPKMRPLEEVRDEVVAALSKEKARDLAYQAAGAFADRFLDRDAQGLVPADFARLAAEDGYTVRTTRLFRATGDYPVNFKVAPDFVALAFDLGGDSMQDLVGDPVGAGEEEAYVEMLVTNVPAHVEPFEAVSERAETLARADKADRAFQEAVNTAREGFVRGLEEGKDFRELAASLGLEAGTNVVFSALAAGQDDAPVPEPRQVARLMVQLGKGDFSGDCVYAGGGAMFFYVVDRQAGDANASGFVRMQMSRQMAEDAGANVWREWLKANLESMSPEPVEPFDGVSDEAAEEIPED